ncbi:MAG: diacylglycerol kinase family lipid kinase [candidate division KSB1 bacterium]|nr:diacylglycerol kinase family lipid kinase [candidate division KSB1 bacterium]MDZ7310434.1 diacylglycerol kinase family lipid kinase [candidate division KSB1 bacterium]
MKPFLIVANPASALGRGRLVMERAVAWFAQKGIETQTVISQYAGHLLEALPPLLEDNWQKIVVVGGDGTLFEVLNLCLDTMSGDGVAPFPTPLALIPSGTGNSFSKDLPADNLEDFLQKSLHGTPQPVDVARCHFSNSLAGGRGWYKNEFYFVNMLGTGFVAEVNVRSQRFKKLGMLGYAVGVFATLAALRPCRLRLDLDGKTVERANTFVAICNSRYTAGNMKIAPEANISDSMIDVVLANSFSRWELVRTFPKVFSGRHTSHPAVEVFRTRQLRVETDPPCLLTPDGETLGNTPIEVEILPGKLRFMV